MFPNSVNNTINWSTIMINFGKLLSSMKYHIKESNKSNNTLMIIQGGFRRYK